MTDHDTRQPTNVRIMLLGRWLLPSTAQHCLEPLVLTELPLGTMGGLRTGTPAAASTPAAVRWVAGRRRAQVLRRWGLRRCSLQLRVLHACGAARPSSAQACERAWRCMCLQGNTGIRTCRSSPCPACTRLRVCLQPHSHEGLCVHRGTWRMDPRQAYGDPIALTEQVPPLLASLTGSLQGSAAHL